MADGVHPDAITLFEFFAECFVPFNGLAIPIKPAHRKIADAVQSAIEGTLLTAAGKRAQFVIIRQPPRTAKTKLMEAAIAWGQGYFSDQQWIYTSYAGPMAELSVDYVRRTLVSEWYQTLFPKTKLGVFRLRNHISTSDGGNIYAEGVFGQLLGKGAGLKLPAGGGIVVDDPAKPDEVLSLVESNRLKFWFENVPLMRRNSTDWTPIFIVSQRLGPDDLSGYVEDRYPDDCVVIKIPQIEQEGTPAASNNFPETRSDEACASIKKANPFVYWAQLQQEPIIIGGNMIKVGDFVLHEWRELQGLRYERKIITMDTAFSEKQASDFSVFQCWGLLNRQAYLVDQVRGQWESPELLANGHEFYRKHHVPPTNEAGTGSTVSRLLIENKSSGIGLIQQFHRLGVPAMPIERTKDKPTRVEEILPYIATHMVHVPKDAPFSQAFLNECAAFRKDGTHAHDDQVDPLCDAVWDLLGKPISILDVVGRPRHR